MIVHSKMISKHHQFIGSLNEKYYHIRIKSNEMIFNDFLILETAKI